MTDNQPQKQPKAVIFDLDGTLINDKGMMRDFSHDVVDQFDNNAAQESSEKSFIGFRKLVEKCFRNFSDQTPKDGAIELLQHLKAQNIPIFVVSSGNQDIVRDIVSKNFAGLIDQDKVYGASGENPTKPDPKAYINPLREHNISLENPAQIMVVGDNIAKDLKPAIKSGMDAVFFNDANKANDTGVKEVKSMRDLLGLLIAKSKEYSPYKNSVLPEEFEILENRMGGRENFGTFTANKLQQENLSGGVGK